MESLLQGTKQLPCSFFPLLVLSLIQIEIFLALLALSCQEAFTQGWVFAPAKEPPCPSFSRLTGSCCLVPELCCSQGQLKAAPSPPAPIEKHICLPGGLLHPFLAATSLFQKRQYSFCLDPRFAKIVALPISSFCLLCSKEGDLSSLAA